MENYSIKKILNKKKSTKWGDILTHLLTFPCQQPPTPTQNQELDILIIIILKIENLDTSLLIINQILSR